VPLGPSSPNSPHLLRDLAKGSVSADTSCSSLVPSITSTCVPTASVPSANSECHRSRPPVYQQRVYQQCHRSRPPVYQQRQHQACLCPKLARLYTLTCALTAPAPPVYHPQPPVYQATCVLAAPAHTFALSRPMSGRRLHHHAARMCGLDPTGIDRLSHARCSPLCM